MVALTPGSQVGLNHQWLNSLVSWGSSAIRGHLGSVNKEQHLLASAHRPAPPLLGDIEL